MQRVFTVQWGRGITLAGLISNPETVENPEFEQNLTHQSTVFEQLDGEWKAIYKNDTYTDYFNNVFIESAQEYSTKRNQTGT